MGNYLYDNIAHDAGKRLEYLEKIEDSRTFEQIAKIDIKKGATCLELGAGKGSVAEHLCTIVGETGSVHAIDIDTRFLKELSFRQLSIIEGNVEEIDLNEIEFDFIHARHVLIHTENYKDILNNLYRSLKPDGWMLIEETDFSTWCAVTSSGDDDVQFFNAIIQNILAFYEFRGIDITCGTGCYRQLSFHDNKVLTSESRCRTVQGGSTEARFHRITMEQLCPSLTAHIHMGDAEITRFLDLHMNTDFHYRTRMTNSIRVQKR